ncbi:MAG: sodium:solute symporter [Frankiales bacterium]|nr:sodium:solute symporter [Frankiales bacterium]
MTLEPTACDGSPAAAPARRAPASDDRVRAAGAVLAGEPVDAVAGRHGVDREQVLLWTNALASGGAAAVADSDPHHLPHSPATAGVAVQDYLQLLARELGEPLTQTRDVLRSLAEAPHVTGGDGAALRTARERVDLATHLTDQLVDVLAITSGEADLHPRGVDLGRLVDTLARPLGLARLPGTDQPARWVEADPDRLQQLVQTLLEAALALAGPADISLDVLGLRTTALLTVRVAGIAPQEHDGLVLPLAHALSRAVGSQIGVTGHGDPSVPDRATVLWARVPLAAEPQLVPQPRAATAPEGRQRS